MMWRYMICLSEIVIQVIKLRTIRWSGMWHAWEGREVNAIFLYELLKERYKLGKLGVYGRIILKISE
jgi:hypothetical protein